MDCSVAISTVFAFLVRNLEFDYSFPKVVALLAITAGGWILTLWDIRRSKKADPGSSQSAQKASRESRVA
jgi:hypothetical protein